MKNKLFILMSTLFVFAFAGCDDDSQRNSSHCDDSGCYGCEGDYCWEIENEPCNDESPCADNEVCTDFGCALLCEHDSDCNLGEECLDTGFCSPKEAPQTICESDADCGNGTICELDPETGNMICIPGCTSDDDCAEDEVCASCNRCEPEDNPVCGDSKVFCENNEDCGSKICSEDHKCALSCETSDPLCPTGQVCSTDGVCIDDPAPENPECVFSSDCGSSFLCLNTYCHSTCEIDDECGYGEFCHLGVCKADYRPDFE
ncbi:MAG: hypothetical protein PF689_10770 [Deltaproteobacteria bacterium]|jgi:hypothetical protein|nr:hypothetical protein [Deltaproteobacteria bacterium]